MDGLMLEWIVKERQRDLLEAAARERLVSRHRLDAFGVVVRLLDALGLSRGRVRDTVGQAASVSGRLRGDDFGL